MCVFRKQGHLRYLVLKCIDSLTHAQKSSNSFWGHLQRSSCRSGLHVFRTTDLEQKKQETPTRFP